MPEGSDQGLKVELKGFQRLHLKPGQTVPVKFVLDPRQLSLVDAAGVRAMRAGKFRVAVGGTQPSEGQHVQGEFSITGMQVLAR
jgi:beta-glucosidase